MPDFQALYEKYPDVQFVMVNANDTVSNGKSYISQSGYTQRYSRIIPLLSEAEISFGKVLEANSVLMNAQAVWEKGIDKIGDDPYYFVEKTI